MADASKLQDLLNRLRALQEGQSIVVTNAQLMELEIPGIADFDHHGRAEWLRKQIACEAKPSATTDQWTFTRPAAKPSGT
jgi:hypothetical protein